MYKLIKFIGRLSVVALIFFSLQGEVIMRYAQIFKQENQLSEKFSAKNAERQKLIKLQCFTQKFYSPALPGRIESYKFDAPVLLLPTVGIYVFRAPPPARRGIGFPSLRGPPFLG